MLWDAVARVLIIALIAGVAMAEVSASPNERLSAFHVMRRRGHAAVLNQFLRFGHQIKVAGLPAVHK